MPRRLPTLPGVGPIAARLRELAEARLRYVYRRLHVHTTEEVEYPGLYDGLIHVDDFLA